MDRQGASRVFEGGLALNGMWPSVALGRVVGDYEYLGRHHISHFPYLSVVGTTLLD